MTELPEGIDPTYLAALPKDMHKDVIDEQRHHLQNTRKRKATQNIEAEVNSNFLDGPPTNIQEQVSISSLIIPSMLTSSFADCLIY